MKSDITFGQYCEGNSVIHRLDPRWKIIVSLMYIAIIFMAKSVGAFVLLLAASVFFVVQTELSPSLILNSIKPLQIGRASCRERV